MNPPPRRFWAVVPAAGSGTRMQTAVPKQYLPLAGRSVLDRTLGALLDCRVFQRLVVVLAPGDTHWPESPLAGDSRIVTATGAALRCGQQRRTILTTAHRPTGQQFDQQ